MNHRAELALARTGVSIVILFGCLVVYSIGQRLHREVQETRAVRVLGAISAAEFRYAWRNPSAGFTCDLEELQREGLIPDDLFHSTRGYYRYTLQGCRAEPCGTAARTFQIIGHRLDSPSRWDRWLCTDQRQVLRAGYGPAGNCAQDADVVRGDLLHALAP